jgi:D-3-phosphoglycerate dehydrogenase
MRENEMKKILVGIPDYENECPKAYQLLKADKYELVINPHPHPFTADEMKELVTDVDGAVAGSEIWNEDIYKYAPKLKIISRFGIGYDSVDVLQAKAHGIIVTNVRNLMLSNGVAEFAVDLMLSVAKKIIPMDRELRKVQWSRFTGRQLWGKTVGIVGFGAIGKCVARMLSGFNVNMLAYDMYPDLSAAKALNVTFVSKDAILEESDFITLHIPSNSENYHFIGERELKQMKKSSFLINTARGFVIDTDALCKALITGEIAGAGLDVFEQEPPKKDLPLYKLDNVIITPHAASENYESKEAVGVDSAQAVIDVINGKVPSNVINP